MYVYAILRVCVCVLVCVCVCMYLKPTDDLQHEEVIKTWCLNVLESLAIS